ncbi:alpha/beta fold hydrolase [Curtobacterium pusillum]|uniref:alpha/beta fold hydrolase n=1 Tax=Curtobacterium pusillum TaxID=69373 RepID=UPI0011A583D7|nr:alpha/beta fold hydrolase [Curtobacterium pusillum]
MRGYVDTEWGQVHYRAGGPAPADASCVVAMYHESPRTSAVYQPVLDAFADDVAVLAFDTPGFGQSDDAPADRPLADYASVLLQALDALGVDRFLPVGMKTGSALVTAMAVEAGADRVPGAVLYAQEEPDDDAFERWATDWAPPITFPADGSTLTKLYAKNVGLYGTEHPRVLYEAVADAISNADRYASVYPAVFRGHRQTWDDMHTLVAAGVHLTVLEPPTAQFTDHDPIVFGVVPGTHVLPMPTTGQFPTLATSAFVDAVTGALHRSGLVAPIAAA